MNNVTYGTVTESYTLGNIFRVSYGIAVYAHADCDGTATVITSVHDVSSEKNKVDDLVSLCNLHHLAPEQLCDVIDDFLAS